MWRQGDLFESQRCNQCRAPHPFYFKPTDEYLCEDCAEWAAKEIKGESNDDEND